MVEPSRNEAWALGPAEQARAQVPAAVPAGLRDLLEGLRCRDDSPFRPHLGLLLWTVRALSPRSFVQIGAGDLLPYFAVCQSVADLDGARCTGIAPPGTAIAPQVLRHEEAFHAGLSRLLPGDPFAAAADCEPGSVDLLLLTAEASRPEALLEAWRPALSPRAVVILHGTGPGLRGAAGAKALAARHPAILRPEGLGLALILVGAEPEPALLAQASLPGGGRIDAAEGFLARLAALSEEAGADSRDKAARDPELADMAARLEAREAEIGRLEAILEERCRELAVLEGALPRGLSRGWLLAGPGGPLRRRWLLAARGRAGKAARTFLDRSPPALAEPVRKAARKARSLLRL